MKTVRRSLTKKREESAQSLSSLVLADDIEVFGPEAALALHELPGRLAEMNRVYRQQVARRALLTVPELGPWIGQRVNVFLRHDAVFVFAIHRDSSVAMANFVELRNASFVVDQTGRRQTLQKTGTLPNLSTVHAFVAGDMIGVENEPPEISPTEWHPVHYRPDHAPHFTLGSCTADPQDTAASLCLPLLTAQHVLMVPGRIKVWCQRPVCGELSDYTDSAAGVIV